MDSLPSLLALAALVSPLVAAAGIAASGSIGRRLPGRRAAMLGALASFAFAAAALVLLATGQAEFESSFSLGPWLEFGPNDPFRIVFSVGVDIPAAALAAIMSLCALCAFAWNRTGLQDESSQRLQSVAASTQRLQSIAASMLLSASLGVVFSTNAAELFVFWQIASISTYFMTSAVSEAAPHAVRSRQFVMTQRLAEACLLCIVLSLAVGYRTLDFDELLRVLARGGPARFALVHFIALCLLGACAGRCALFPFLGVTDGFAAGPRLTTVLVQGVCLVPAGVLLLIRFLPILHLAAAASAFAVLWGAAAAFAAAVCAWSLADARQQASFACASVLGIIVVGLSLPVPEASAWAMVLTATYLPTSAALLGWFAERNPPAFTWQKSGTLAARAVALSLAILFSGICGQGGIVGAGLTVLAQRATDGEMTLALALVFVICAQFFAALGLTRALLVPPGGELPAPTRLATFETDFRNKRSSWPLVVLAACAALVGALGGALTLAGPPEGSAKTILPSIAGGNVVASLLGCLPALAGFLAGWTRSTRAAANRPQREADGVLLRLGRNRFYCSAFMAVLIVLPLRGLAQLARFVDWFFVDGFVSGAPASALQSAALVLEPIQGRRARFYLTSALLGTALLAAVVIWLRY